MVLFDLFTSNKAVNSDVEPVDVNIEQDVNNENPVENAKDNESKKLITITWGTGMPIGVIFNFIHKNFEEEGFQDALINQDVAYRDAKEKIIRNDLEMLFKRMILRYRSDIRVVNAKIRNAQRALALGAASDMEALRETYEEHLEEIREMQELLEKNDPKMTTMIESYRRGFLKGIAANTVNFMGSNK